MIEARLLPVWDGVVEVAALLAMIVFALFVMVGAVKREDILRHLGLIVGIVILLLVLPAIILSLWSSMTLLQHLGIFALGIAFILLFSMSRRRQHNRREK